MKKFISMVMTAAMVASLVPATAFAKATDFDVKATASVAGKWTKHQDDAFNGKVDSGDVPELRLSVTESKYYQSAGNLPEMEVEVRLDNAEFVNDITALEKGIKFFKDNASIGGAPAAGATKYKYTEASKADVERMMADYFYNDNKSAFSGYKYVTAGELAGSTVVNTTVESKLAGTDLIDGTDIKKPVEKSVEDQRKEKFEANLDALGVQSGAKYGVDYDYVTKSPYGEGAGLEMRSSSTKTGPKFISYQKFLDTVNGGKEFVKTIEPATFNAWWNETKGTTSTTKSVGEVVYEKMAGNKIAKESTYRDDATNVDKLKVKTGSVVLNKDKDVLTFVIEGFIPKDAEISVDLLSIMDKTSRNALVSVTSDMVNANDLVYVQVADKGIKASIQKVEKVAVDEVKELHNSGLKIEETVDNSYAAGDKVTLRLNQGFEFVKTSLKANDVAITDADFDDNTVTFKIPAGGLDANHKMVIKGLKVEATSAKAGAKATIEVKIADLDSVKVEVMEAVDYKVNMTVDKDKEVPTFYSGVDAKDTGLTSDKDHKSLEITLEETFPGAWSSRKGFNITVPEGVYVTDVQVKDAAYFNKDGKDFNKDAWKEAFKDAYQDGDHKTFKFDKRVFDDVNHTLEDKAASMTFVLTLVADYEFGGTADKPAEVKIGFEGDTVDKQEVVVAKFVKPYTVEAEQNDLKIDARQTKLEKNIVVKETADGLWDKNTEFVLGIEKDLIAFEEGAKFEVSKDSGLEIKDHFKKDTKDTRAKMSFDVKSVGDKKADVTVSDISLFMERNIPQGEYGLELTGTLRDAYVAQKLFAPDDAKVADGKAKFGDKDLKDDNFVDDVTDSSETVNKKFINVITARRDEDGFTTRIAVPVGETFIFAGVDKLEGAANSMEVPAYINKDNYTMLPLRAVARALGIANGNIYWNQATQTATVQYGNSRIMTFKLGAKEMIINGHSMPAVAGIEMTNNRLFLSLRDLGVAMNVPAEKIAWDSKTKTAYLNPTEEDMAAIKG